MSTLPKDIVFVSAKRTPFGGFGGAFKKLTAIDLGVEASNSAMAACGVAPEDIDHVIFGNVMQTSADAIYMARHIGLRAGLPQSTPGLTVNRLCGSGFQSIVNAAQEILTGQATTVLAGGTESMSQAPYVLRDTRWGTRLGQAPPLSDSLWDGLYDPVADLAMAGTAEKLAAKYDVSREEADAFAMLSQQRFANAQREGYLTAEMAPVTMKTRKGDLVVDTDEHPRETNMEGLGKLRTVLKDGVITAGNASGINDGAGAVIVTTLEHAKNKGWAPLARLVSWGVVGCDPKIMGIGPVGAIKNALSMAKLELSDIDLVEVNEAFAPQTIACERALGLDRDKLNVNGGAIAVGHPLAASGARITAHAIHELRRQNKNLGVVSACIGGGQGIALTVEAL
jgi:acetyl-CoA acyltransferase 2